MQPTSTYIRVPFLNMYVDSLMFVMDEHPGEREMQSNKNSGKCLHSQKMCLAFVLDAVYLCVVMWDCVIVT